MCRSAAVVFMIFVTVELEARENAALQKATKEKSFKEQQQAKDAAKVLEQEVSVYCVFSGICSQVTASCLKENV